ncbi:hypothetical protein MWN41_04890 [Ornithobacterium rhinotracheale]|uniref:hypothetical protein n=1 Tax=Ornithobacterium rhinotracheale TaxID=28251 RepID=UPI001FF2EC21|nr:hypothetical protein [Ornithobacterium rhinotracheale]MCK0202356.1 hypothetical protein [Ornithobacterium rhinotracheale]
MKKKDKKVATKELTERNLLSAVIAATNADNTKGAIVALGCETDFVAKRRRFRSFG